MTTTISTTSQPARTAQADSTGRVFTIGGFAFAALTLGAIGLQGGESPAATASATTVAAFFRDHATQVKVSEACAAAGLGALVWWFAGLWRIIRSDDRSPLPMVAAIGLAIGLALGFVDITFTGTAALGASWLGSSELRLLNQASLIAVLLSGLGNSAFLAATCVINARIRAFPTWTNYVGLLSAAGWLVGAVAVNVTTSAAVLSAGYAAFVLWCVWIVALSVSMLTRGDSTSAAPIAS